MPYCRHAGGECKAANDAMKCVKEGLCSVTVATTIASENTPSADALTTWKPPCSSALSLAG